MTPFAEVIRSNTTLFEAEVYPDEPPPAFGSWVSVDSPEGNRIYALVSHIEMGSLETNRRATALRMDTEALQREMPHVLALLRTSIHAQVLAYRDASGHVYQTLPPFPPPIHGFVIAASQEEVRCLGSPYDFLRTLIVQATPGTPTDDLLVAAMHQLFAAHMGGPDGQRALIEAGRTLSRLMNDDHERLHSILRRANRPRPMFG